MNSKFKYVNINIGNKTNHKRDMFCFASKNVLISIFFNLGIKISFKAVYFALKRKIYIFLKLVSKKYKTT
jgi:hypothetical protein